MATNVTFHEVREAIIAALMNVYISEPTKSRGIIKKWAPLLERFTEDAEVQMDILFILQRYFAKALREAGSAGKFVRALQDLYDADVLEEDKIIRWYGDERARGAGEKWGKDMLAVRDSAEKFVTWLEEAEEESDEE